MLLRWLVLQSIVEHSLDLYEARICVDFVHPEEGLPSGEAEANISQVYVCHSLAFLDFAHYELGARTKQNRFSCMLFDECFVAN